MLMSMFKKHPEQMTFEKLFPEFQMNTEEKEKAIEHKWREFLGR